MGLTDRAGWTYSIDRPIGSYKNQVLILVIKWFDLIVKIMKLI